MNPADWSYVSGLVSAQSDRLLNRRTLLGVFQAGSDDERRSRLRASLLFADTPPGEQPVDEIESRFENVVRKTVAAGPDPRMTHLFLHGPRWTVFRRYLKETLLGRSGGLLPAPAEDDAARRDWCAAAAHGQAEDPADALFARAAQRAQQSVSRAEDAAGCIDRAADAWEAASLPHVARLLGSAVLTHWLDTWTQLRAALALVRARRNGWPVNDILTEWRAAGFDAPALTEIAQGDPGGWPGALHTLGLPNMSETLAAPEPTAPLAHAIDLRLAALARDASGMPFGPERVFAFLWAVRLESVNLKLLLTAASSGIPEDGIAAQLLS